MELVVKKIIEAKDVSKFTMQRMAHVLMEAPADFDYCQSFPPFSKTREFLQTQPKTVRARFKRECYKWPIYTRRRTKWLLGLPLD
jgi:hypothetical protein